MSSSGTTPLFLVHPVTEVEAGFDGETLTVSWKNPVDGATPEATEIALQGTWSRQTMIVTSSPCAMVVRKDLLIAPGDWTLTLTPLLDAARGPGTQTIIERFSAPVELSARWAPAGATCTLAWAAAESGGGLFSPAAYKVEILSGSVTVSTHEAHTTNYDVPDGALTAAGGYSFRVCAVSGEGPCRAGVWSAPAPIVSGAPSTLTLDYDGATLSARWSPVPGATGYHVGLIADDQAAGDPWFVAGTESETRLHVADLDTTKTYALAVQAIGPGAAGPAATAPVFGAGLYPRFEHGCAPMLIPAVAPDMAPHPIALGLPDLFAKPPDDAELPEAPPFSLNKVFAAPYSYVLNIAEEMAWKPSSEAVREGLYAAYCTFLGALEERGATPLGVQTVQAAIARSMPQTFSETLLYTYGFTPDQGFVDLRPGMLLRVEYEGSTTVNSAAPRERADPYAGYHSSVASSATGGAASRERASTNHNGFVANGVARHRITRASGPSGSFTALDAFIGWLTAHGGTTVDSPGAAERRQGGGLIDSGRVEMRRPFLRLVYPRALSSAEFNVMILAAPTLRALDAATAIAREGSAVGPDTGALVFRGRTTLVPEIHVWVNGAAMVVPLGTTVIGVLAELGMDPPDIDLPLRGLRLRRGAGQALVGLPGAYDTRGATPVRLDWAPGAKAALTSLPLLGGDRLEVG